MRRFAFALLCTLMIAPAAAKDSGFVFVSKLSAGAKRDSNAGLSLRLAGYRPRRQAERRVPLAPGKHSPLT
jgi:hypothetical protein